MSRLEDGGRVTPETAGSRYERELVARHVFAYRRAAEGFVAPGDTVLEVGAGEGYGSAILAGRAGSVTALDADPAAMAHAAARYALPNLKFLAHRGETLPFPDASFDKAAAFQVIEHLPDPAVFIKEAARVLKPGGRLLLTTPNRVHRLAEGQKPWYKFHVREFSAAELAALLRRDFSSCEVKFVQAPPSHFELEVKVARAATLAQRLDPLGLRDLVPYGLKRLVFGLLSRGPAGAEPPPPDFTLGSGDLRGLDLWAEASK